MSGIIGRATTLMARLLRRSRYEVARRLMPSTAVLGPKVVPRVRGPLGEQSDVRLNLGCGPMHLDGYVNIDADPRACADFYMRFDEVAEAFARDSIVEILMIHSLSYLNLWQARDFFHDAYRLLRTGGKLIVELPSIEKCARHLLESSGDQEEYLEAVRGIYAFDPSEISNKVDFTSYSFGWSSWHLKAELTAAGFSQFSESEPHYHEQPWRDIRLEATK
ncbi:class I SAM-dependent methyltransferase [Roseiconus lacunae]|uniref:Methyltransferase type 11 domain-containing protein n=1 Tax=Roseiconus lacunae TaxID=2605694 RepID=A0ABT7PL87_9BACT|nr:hypothetical protein [Roseiconus lacunae]MCD0461131.1 hypothetical protein [Roseiconus lacunae]MDM4017036.1 hypothetical protein [Roseiconus lacunae]WRQ48965.1 hypothetical protein U8335_18605 [Stieleria sp. HD01]